ncbi:MAG: hypothetical protein SWJ54_12945 [Cyanobacteriota bacterium]|nr:hypothetical protein [Cyanobacteriota bacterium]
MASSVTFTSATLEGQLLEVVERVANLQVQASKNPNNVNTVTAYNTNSLTNVLTVTLSIPITTTVGASGKIETNAVENYVD